MFKEITSRQAGGSITVTIPKEFAERLHIKAGDPLFASEVENGILLSPYDPNFKDVMALYEEGSRQFRNALHELAQ